jgi:hypothetical protein
MLQAGSLHWLESSAPTVCGAPGANACTSASRLPSLASKPRPVRGPRPSSNAPQPPNRPLMPRNNGPQTGTIKAPKDKENCSSTAVTTLSVTSKRQQLNKYTRCTLGVNYLRHAVRLPAGEHWCEWLAIHSVDFWNAISLLVGIATADQHLQSPLEPGWGFPPGFEYLWPDSTSKRTIKCSG